MTVENLHDAIGQLPSDLIAKVDEKRTRKARRILFPRYAAMAACLALILWSGWFFTRLFSPKGSAETAAQAPMMQAMDTINGMGSDEAAAPEAGVPAAENPPEEEAAAVTGGTSAETFAVNEVPGEEDLEICGYPTLETYAADEIPSEGVTEETWAGYPEFPAEDVQYVDTRNIGTACTTSDPVLRVLRSRTELEDFRERFGYYDLEAFDLCCENYDDNWFESHELLVVLVRGKYADGTLSLASVTESGGDWCVRLYSGGPYSGEKTDRFVLAALEKDMIPEESHLFAMFEVP